MVMTQAPRWVEYGLVLLAAWVVSSLFVGNQNALNQDFKVPQVAEVNTVEKDSLVFRQVELFGEAQGVDKPVQQQKKVVASRLNIKLVGTVVAGDKSAAMISIGGSKKQKVVFLNEEVQSGVKLVQVETAAIVVDNRGKKERIAIVAGKGIVSSPVKQVRGMKPKRRVALPAKSHRIDRKNLQKQMRNFSSLLSQARVTPHFTDKKPDGFMISEIVKGSFYEEIGLLNGDIIQKVNGESVTGAEQAMRMYRELQNATFIDVEVVRGGSLQQISYTIQ